MSAGRSRSRPLRVLWASNAPWVPSGYGVQTRLFASRLARLGCEVAVGATAGLSSGQMRWEGLRCLPAEDGRHGAHSIPMLAERWGADVVLTLMDAWVYEGTDVARGRVPWVPWFPVDMEPIPPPVVEAVRNALAALVMTRFAEHACLEAGLEPLYLPHGIDTTTFSPGDAGEAREALGLPRDAYVVGMVATNQDWPSRKALPQALSAFARFAERHEDAVLYLHTAVCGKGIDLRPLIEWLGLTQRVFHTEDYVLLLGASDAWMAGLYRAFDCLLSPSLGEGFGIPIVEAQACGCPVIVGDWTGMAELCFAGLRIPRERSEPLWTPLRSFYRVPHVDAIEEALESLYRERDDTTTARRARAGVLDYDVECVVERHLRPALSTIEARLSQHAGDRSGVRPVAPANEP